jgi:hypothetical protein
MGESAVGETIDLVEWSFMEVSPLDWVGPRTSFFAARRFPRFDGPRTTQQSWQVGSSKSV